jgi:indole-3-glycerol phosphate synthase
MSDILTRIAAYKREEVDAARQARPLPTVEAAARDASPTRGFRAALARRAVPGDYALIAEIKKASPSKGLIREDFAPRDLAIAYREGGAACLSVLTDTPSFQGSPAYLARAREATDLPVLRKDFMLDPYQVAEARAIGADCILIIMAMVGDDQARELEDAAFAWNMDVLVEVHNEEELDRALRLRTTLLGINNRDLKTFETTLAVTQRLAPMVPDGHLVVSESGLNSNADLESLAGIGVRTFLIGESLMRQPDVAAATRAILRAPEALRTHSA